MNHILHIGISVVDIDRSVQWYTNLFGFKEVTRFEKAELEIKAAVLCLGEHTIELIAPYRPQPLTIEGNGLAEALRSIGVNHIAVAVDDINGIYGKCLSNKAEMVTELIHGRMFFCRDPDGTLLEIKAGG
jgi:catechol 2,3-dioxygenase-like lactoylglutathione lyase family enzyme